ncbi:DUF86 domain-containing protein [Synechococcus sp. GFB01]|uniref:HepT-like ribonuclease domain-containing protein n=1 Tax=Synechococcus sp. GFB01 TaxID=1662190 RepID=UPI00064E6315|nr:HepT-like ribonuclease domain-containing protein [Synechococcus sp. GFB01]KMM17816.1 hypothetical protein SYNGFB01_01430 [Synechococcus sp. GFB01]
MPRDLTAYLQDILDASAAIADVMRGVSIEDYRNTRSIRSSVEREFIIIGAALRRIGDLDARLFASISNSRAIVDFRNLLAHDYGAIDDDSVFGIVYSDLIVLQAEVAELLQKLTSAN